MIIRWSWLEKMTTSGKITEDPSENLKRRGRAKEKKIYAAKNIFPRVAEKL